MKILKNLVLASILVISHQAFAAEPHSVTTISTEPTKRNDYYANYYDEEGPLLFKIRGFFASTQAKSKNLPDPTNAGTTKPGKLTQNGYGFDTAMTIFVTNNIAAEISLGLGYFSTKASTIQNAISAYGTSTALTVGKKNEIYTIPFTLSLQYHIAPFGGIRPYIGGGYNGTYVYSRSKAIKVKSGHGPVVQLGIDFIAKDDALFTLDIRQHFLKSKMAYKKTLLGTTQNVSSTVVWNPLIVSVGFGFKF